MTTTSSCVAATVPGVPVGLKVEGGGLLAIPAPVTSRPVGGVTARGPGVGRAGLGMVVAIVPVATTLADALLRPLAPATGRNGLRPEVGPILGPEEGGPLTGAMAPDVVAHRPGVGEETVTITVRLPPGHAAALGAVLRRAWDVPVPVGDASAPTVRVSSVPAVPVLYSIPHFLLPIRLAVLASSRSSSSGASVVLVAVASCRGRPTKGEAVRVNASLVATTRPALGPQT